MRGFPHLTRSNHLEYLDAVRHFNCVLQKVEVEKGTKYINTTPLEEFDILGGWDNDRVFVVRPRRIEDIDCINTINKYINTDGTSILNYYNIGEIYILIFGADCYVSDLENYEYLTVKTASEVIKYNTQKIMDIITIMSKEETETEDN